IAEDNTFADARAYGIIPLSPQDGHDTPNQTVGLGKGATLTAGGTNVIEPFLNKQVVSPQFAATDLGPKAIRRLGSLPPTITSPNTMTVSTGSGHVLNVTATDPQNDPLTYGIVTGRNPDVFTINPTSGELSFKTPTAPGTYVVLVTADNGNGG